MTPQRPTDLPITSSGTASQQESANSIELSPGWMRFIGYPAAIGLLLVIVTGVLAFLSDWLGGTHVTRLWQQLSGTFFGMMFCVLAVSFPSLIRLYRLLLFSEGLLLLVAVIDSLDGRQDLIPGVSLLLTFWAGIYAYIAMETLKVHRIRSFRHWFAIVIGSIAALVYLATAVYYIALTQSIGPITVDRHPLYGLGIILSTFVTFMADIRPGGGKLSGNPWFCPACGLPNIAERRICKRCRRQRASLEQP